MINVLIMVLISCLLVTIFDLIVLIRRIPRVRKTEAENKSKENDFSWQHLNTISYKKSFFEELELSIIFRSGIKTYFPNLNLKSFLLLVLLLTLVSFAALYSVIGLLVPSLILTFIILIMPFIVLNIMEQNRNNLISKELTRFISIISRWSIVKDDIYYCFEKSLDQISDPIKSNISDFLINVKYTGNISYAFDMLLLQSNNELYRNFVINIRQAEQSKGDLSLLLDNLEDEVYKIQAENDRRKSVTLKDRTLIYITMIAVLLIGICIIKFNANIREFYLDTVFGKYLLTSYSILFFFGVYVTSKITTFDY